jgi:hypothetical protein
MLRVERLVRERVYGTDGPVTSQTLVVMCFGGSDGSDVTKPHAKTGTLFVALEAADGRECILPQYVRISEGGGCASYHNLRKTPSLNEKASSQVRRRRKSDEYRSQSPRKVEQAIHKHYIFREESRNFFLVGSRLGGPCR